MINSILHPAARDLQVPARPCDLSPRGVYDKAEPDHDSGPFGRSNGSGIPMFSPFISLTAAERNELLTLVLKGSDDLTYPGCASELVDVYQRSYLQIVTRSVRASLSANRISRQAVAEVLARNVGHINRTLKDGAFTADQILRLERAFGAVDNDIRRINAGLYRRSRH